MVPGELLNDIVIHQERAAHHRHQEIRHRQVCDEQVGDVAQLFVAHQHDDEEAVPDTADKHDADQDDGDDDGGDEKGSPLSRVRNLVHRNVVIQCDVVACNERVLRVLDGWLTLSPRCCQQSVVSFAHRSPLVGFVAQGTSAAFLSPVLLFSSGALLSEIKKGRKKLISHCTDYCALLPS